MKKKFVRRDRNTTFTISRGQPATFETFQHQTKWKIGLSKAKIQFRFFRYFA